MLLPSGRARRRIIATSPPVRLDGTFQPILAGCQDEIFGWTRDSHGAALLRVNATGALPRYSRRLPPYALPPKLKAIAFSDHCKTVWVATISHDLGVVSRLHASSLSVTGQLHTAYLRALL
jgi:hypothetical protein